LLAQQAGKREKGYQIIVEQQKQELEAHARKIA